MKMKLKNILIIFIIIMNRRIKKCCNYLVMKVEYLKSLLKLKELRMPRPLKELPDNKVQTEDSEPNGNIINKLELNDLAFAVVFDQKSKKYAAVKVPFDFNSGNVGNPIVVEENTDKHLMEDRLQVLIWQNI